MVNKGIALSKQDLVFVPLGGVGEIGMNLALYGFGDAAKRKWIMVDCGVTFPGPDLPGVDLVLPDIRFVESIGKDLLAVVITHAHEDHYGALLSLWQRLGAPIYCTAFTAGMLDAKAQYEGEPPNLPLEIYKAGDSIDLDPFEIEPVYVNHSIPEPMSLAINSPLGRIIHTGDWKLDEAPTLGKNTDSDAFKRLGDEGVLALICDSTNAMRDGESPTEREVSDSLANLITEAQGRVAITTFSSNVGRIRSIAQAAEKAGRKVMLVGSSIRRVVEVASDLNMFDDIPDFVEDIDFQYIDRNQLVIILTGSQGENRAALANKTLVHVSGHPRRHELKQMYAWTKPEILIPVHGEAAHLNAQARLGGEAGIPQVLPIRNGDLVKLAPGLAEIIDQVPFGRIYKDGNIIADEAATGVKERRKLSYAGHIAVSIVLDRAGDMADDLDIALQGLPKKPLG